MAESEEELKNHLMRVKEESEKADLKINIKKKHNWDQVSGPNISWQIDREKVEPVTDFIFLDSKITWMMTAAMKLKGTGSLEEKLWQT